MNSIEGKKLVDEWRIHRLSKSFPTIKFYDIYFTPSRIIITLIAKASNSSSGIDQLEAIHPDKYSSIKDQITELQKKKDMMVVNGKESKKKLKDIKRAINDLEYKIKDTFEIPVKDLREIRLKKGLTEGSIKIVSQQKNKTWKYGFHKNSYENIKKSIKIFYPKKLIEN
jgi:hypothetical protein